ncbi:Hypothetical protein SMAX5B_003984 [Scophthalmus maximus]|uniref:Uncharacterized protein n=1 Tax=Scophthalmus maximus TaxID=52904 RepID=A0A2U9C7J9_SCOMX|nr:Hypothetical protein SMAX5B_003984 [Scophthalmus maximus]
MAPEKRWGVRPQAGLLPARRARARYHGNRSQARLEHWTSMRKLTRLLKRAVERGEEGVAYEAHSAAAVGDGAEVGVLARHPRTWEPKTQLIFM